MFGIGCRLSSISAIKKISRLKQRSENSGYIALIPDIEWLPENGIEIPQPLIHILNHYWPGNLTVIIPVHDERFGAISVNRKVAFRVPEDYMLRQMLEYLGEPMLSTSINISGVPPADNLNDIRKRYESWFDLGIIPNDTKLAEPSTIIEYIDSDKSGKAIHPYLKCLRESVIPFYEIKQLFSEPTILFVCTGNICRSPIAEYLFNHYGKSRKLPYTAKSAGLVESGVSISSHSLSLLKEKGINADNHVSQKINPELLGGSWLVLTMEEKQRDIIRIQYPDYAGKVYSIKEYIGEKGDIADPIGNDLDYYRNIYNQIDEALVKLFPRLTNNPDETRK
jgi:tRNA threonylcarbamoyl adenosine modification protein (Sua5/YciO/YrdC/YwlC family)